MVARLVALCVDAVDPRALARFWAEVLGWEVDPSTDGDEPDVVTLLPTDETGFQLDFGRVAEPKATRNRAHFDLTTTSFDDRDALVAKVLALGGDHADVGQGPDDTHVVLVDPEGNELCVIAPGNDFLAGCPRIGAVNCDGTREVGYFWSAALGWPLVWDQDEETAIQAPDGTGPKITWSGPPLMPKHGKNRLHFDIAAPVGEGQAAEVERLVSLGASPVDIGQGDVDWVVMADPDGNEFCVLAR